ncbi:hypothetical protein D7044_08160 [Micromonospora musae]|uniref:Uncharacterized protein n=1 Tax=Micromonospora musae TaxID=1894970 RepID=A0A3A9YC02_9ACTN|nr:hypothetical protein D7044_08160 [Micromonospora musae]
MTPARKFILAGVTLMCLTSCGLDSEGQATKAATDAVRSRAALAQDTASAVLADPKRATQTPEQQLTALATAASAADRHGVVFGQRTGQDGHLEVDVAYDEAGHGGGYIAAEVHVRLCVRLSGVADKDPHVDIVDIACDPALDQRPNRPDQIVTFAPVNR